MAGTLTLSTSSGYPLEDVEITIAGLDAATAYDLYIATPAFLSTYNPSTPDMLLLDTNSGLVKQSFTTDGAGGATLHYTPQERGQFGFLVGVTAVAVAFDSVLWNVV